MPLAPQLRIAAEDCLFELAPKWLEIEPLDYRRVVRPNSDGGFTINIEPYKGLSTRLRFRQLVETSPKTLLFDAALTDFHPELRSYLVTPGRSMLLQKGADFIQLWCQQVAEHPEVSLKESIEKVLQEFSDLLDRKYFERTIISVLSGLNLPPSIDNYQLSEELTLRRLTADEITNLGSNDITQASHHDVVSHSVYCCAEFRCNMHFRLEPAIPEAQVPAPEDDTAKNLIDLLLMALHVLKPGRTGVFITYSDIRPALMPAWLGGTSWPLQRPFFATLELSEAELGELKIVFSRLRDNLRDEVRIASNRLLDAESRMSAVDSLLDAAIGLEVLLNPMDFAELAFRVALNYAFLGTPDTRRSRYDRLRAIQKTRNRVVHGGLNLQSPDARLISEHSELAKASLRDALKSFLLDPTVYGNKKLDSDFWLERIIPDNVLKSIELAGKIG